MDSDINWLKRMLSHNVRMPISIVMGYGDLLEKGLVSQDEQKEIIANICENLSYINDIMKVVLDDDNGEKHIEAVDIAALIKRSSEFVREVARKNFVDIRLSTEMPKMFIQAETIPVMRVLYQLFENSLKYMDNGGIITINAFYVEDDNILVVFKDNGNGISEKDRNRIFDKGFRGSNSKGKPGSGYGLYEVKQTVEKFGGTIDISSKEETGFSVYMIFPAYKEEV